MARHVYDIKDFCRFQMGSGRCFADNSVSGQAVRPCISITRINFHYYQFTLILEVAAPVLRQTSRWNWIANDLVPAKKE